MSSTAVPSGVRDPSQYDRLSEQDKQQLDKLFGNWREIPDSFKAAMTDYLSVNPPAIPISQILGFSQFTANASARVGSSDETTASTAYVNLATVGPTLSGLADGSYLVFLRAVLRSGTAGEGAVMGVAINGGSPGTDTEIIQKNDQDTTVTGFFITTLSGGNGSLQAKYRSTDSGATAVFSGRQIAAFRYAN